MKLEYRNEQTPQDFWYDEPTFRRMYGLNTSPVTFSHVEGPLTKNLSIQCENNGGRLANGYISRGTDYHNNSGFDKGYKLSYTYVPTEDPSWILNAMFGREKAYNDYTNKYGIEYVNNPRNAKSHISYEYSKSGNIPVNNFNIGGKLGATDISLDYTKVGDLVRQYGLGVKGRYGKDGDLYFKAGINNRGNYLVLGMYGKRF